MSEKMTEEKRQELLKQQEENIRAMQESGTQSLNEVALCGVVVEISGRKEQS